MSDLTHVTHCCWVHGCKYGDEDCPVAIGRLVQSEKCEQCYHRSMGNDPFIDGTLFYKPDPNAVVETDTNKRWEMGMPHHPKSEAIFRLLRESDRKYGGDYFQWKWGGDGDNGEILMYALDVLFEKRERDLRKR